MSLIAIPSVASVVRVAFGGGAPTLLGSVLQTLAAVPALYLADVQLSAGGSGALWEAALVFTPETEEATPIALVADLRVRAVQAGSRAELQAEITRAIADLLALDAITWIPKVAIAGAGSGAVFCALVFGAVGDRPTGGGGGGPAGLLRFPVNASGVDVGYPDRSMVLRTGAAVNPAGAYNGGGTGNKAIAGAASFTGIANSVPASSLVSVEYTFRNLLGPGGPFFIPPTGGTVTTPYLNFLVDFGGGDLRILVACDDSLAPAITGSIGTYVNDGFNVLTYSWNAGMNVLIVNSPPNAVPGAVPPAVSVGATWPDNAYSWAALLAANPAATIVTAFPANPAFFPTGDGGMPVGAFMPGILLVSGDSGNVVKSGKRVLNWKINGSNVLA